MELKIYDKEIKQFHFSQLYELEGCVLLTYHPELKNFKNCYFKKITTYGPSKDDDDIEYYVLYTKGVSIQTKHTDVKTRIIRHYSKNKAMRDGPSSYTIKFNRIYHWVHNSYILV